MMSFDTAISASLPIVTAKGAQQFQTEYLTRVVLPFERKLYKTLNT